MNIIKINQDEINFLKCFYGKDKNVINTTNKVKEYLNTSIKNEIYFITLKINNKTMGQDPLPGKIKIFYLHFKDKKYQLNENDNICFCIKLSFDIVFKNKINKIGLDKYNYCTIFGKGPTFKNVNKKDKELRCAINQASNIAKDVDFICMNDHHNIFKIDNDVYKNLKYLLIPEYLHINQNFSNDGYFVNILNYLNDKFFGKLIIYNLKTSKKNTTYLINLDTLFSSGNNCFEFIGKYTNIKLVDLYGIGLYGQMNYNKLFIGNGVYDKKRIKLISQILNFCANQYNVKFKLN